MSEFGTGRVLGRVQELEAKLSEAERGREDAISALAESVSDRELVLDKRIAELEAELEQARKERDDVVVAGAMAHEHVKRERDRLRDELEQARKDAQTCPHSNCDAQRYRNALERIEKLPFLTAQGAKDIAHAALDGKGQT